MKETTARRLEIVFWIFVSFVVLVAVGFATPGLIPWVIEDVLIALILGGWIFFSIRDRRRTST